MYTDRNIYIPIPIPKSRSLTNTELSSATQLRKLVQPTFKFEKNLLDEAT